MTFRDHLAMLTHQGTAWIQAVLSLLFIGAYFVILLLFMKGDVHVPEEFKDAFTALLGVLTATVVMVMQFWFARQRASADPARRHR